jgi:transposase
VLYLGIDQHAKQLTVSLRDEAGNVVQARQVSTQPQRVREYLESLKKLASDGFIAIVEVCGFNDWLLKLLPTYGCTKVALIQPEKKRRIKTDQRDAKELSELLWVNRDRIARGEPVRGVRQVVIPNPLDTENQRLTLVRQQISRQHTRIVNQVKHILRRHNLQWDIPTKTFPSKKALLWLKTLELPSWDRHEMNWLMEELDRLPKRLDVLDAEIIKRADGIKEIEILRTIPGCGYFTALAMQSRIGDPNRFPRGRSLPNYFGLTPSVADSGEATGRRGHITKAGSTVVRWLLGQMVLHVLRKDSEMKRWYKSIRVRRGSKVARVAVMRRLCTVIRNMLVDNKDYCTCRKEMIDRRINQAVNQAINKSKKNKALA